QFLHHGAFALGDYLYQREHLYKALRRPLGEPGAGPARHRDGAVPALRRRLPLGARRVKEKDMQPIIRTEALRYTYPGDECETLHGIDLEIKEGSFVAVLGHNGSGKSTLAKLMNAILLPSSGKVYVDGIDTSDEARLLDVRRTV